MPIQFHQLTAKENTSTLSIDNWHIEAGQSWGIFSSEGDIGSMLGDLLCGEITPESCELNVQGCQIAQVSLSEQQRLLELEIERDDTDFLDRIDQGSSVYNLIFDVCQMTPSHKQ